MILGIGNDITDIRRIEEVLKRHGQRFIERCFTKEEIAYAEAQRKADNHISIYAKRFAAKEACAKALGTGIAHGVFLKDIGVSKDQNGKPCLELKGGAKQQLLNMTPDDMTARTHISLSDDYPMAAAFVILEAV